MRLTIDIVLTDCKQDNNKVKIRCKNDLIIILDHPIVILSKNKVTQKANNKIFPITLSAIALGSQYGFELLFGVAVSRPSRTKVSLVSSISSARASHVIVPHFPLCNLTCKSQITSPPVLA